MNEPAIFKLDEQFVSDIRNIIITARTTAIRSVDFERVKMYWKLGERIFIEEQKGQDRAEYGAYLLQNVALEIEKEFGSGFSVRQLERARRFYRTYPIATALRTQLNWYQYRLLIQISDNDKREYYELETANNNWTGRELERQINSGLYERLLLSNDKKSVLEVARKERQPESPTEIIKDPMVLEFLGLKPDAAYYEKRPGARPDHQSAGFFNWNWGTGSHSLPAKRGYCSKMMNSSQTWYFTTGCSAASSSLN